MKLSMLLVLVAFVMGTQTVSACDEHGITGIAEENNLWIPAGMGRDNGMTEERFNAIIDRAEEIYAPIISDEGATLQVVRKWSDGTVNAYAQQTGSTWKVTMFGGLARHDFVTDDAFALVVCHELGHHLGGAPKKKQIFWSSWASNEGQSDYFANSKCSIYRY